MVNNLGEEAGICPKCGARMYYDEICSTDENGNEISCVAPRCFGCKLATHPLVERAFTIISYTLVMAVKEWMIDKAPDMSSFEQSVIEELGGFFDKLDEALEKGDPEVDIFKEELLHELREGDCLNKSRYFDTLMGEFLDDYTPEVSKRVKDWLVGIIKKARRD